MSSTKHTTIVGNQKLRSKKTTLRRPLQPKNSLTDHTADNPSSQQWIEISLSNKENLTPTKTPPIKKTIVEPFDASLADELGAVKKKLERMKLEKEKTEKLLDERDRTLDEKMEEMEKRWDSQWVLEMEVEKLKTLKQLLLGSLCLKNGSVKSLREVEVEKKTNGAHQLVDPKPEEAQGARRETY